DAFRNACYAVAAGVYDIVVACDEQTYDAVVMFVGAPDVAAAAGGGAGGPVAPVFTPAQPPPLAPGMTEPLPLPDPDHMHQLKVLRLD
ncbi:MAG: hypothetical protein ACE5JG_06985, partial [Planctomycetota bacterium]